MVLLNSQQPTLINREQAEKIAEELLSKLEPEYYPEILALPREEAIRTLVNKAAVNRSQYEEGSLANAVLVLEDDLTHQANRQEPYQ
jgi:hypothetical protein